jgi:hypothetical protein
MEFCVEIRMYVHTIAETKNVLLYMLMTFQKHVYCCLHLQEVACQVSVLVPQDGSSKWRCELRNLIIVFRLGRTLRDSWMASHWRWLVGRLWTCATLPRKAKQFSARVDSTEIVRAADFIFCSKYIQQYHNSLFSLHSHYMTYKCVLHVTTTK